MQELELEEFVTHEVGFDEINSAFELLAQGKCLRCIIWMDGAKEIMTGSSREMAARARQE